MTASDILASRIAIAPKIRGIYFLIDGNQIVYVGQSANIAARIVAHADAGKVFDGYAYIESADDLNELEAHYIFTLRPSYNSVMPPNAFYKSIEYLKRHLDTGMYPLKRYIRARELASYLGTYDIRQFVEF